MTIFSIYKATNTLTGKSYIGFDSNWPMRRYVHKHNSLKKNSPYHFHRAIRKYGWNAFEWEAICQSQDGDHLLNVMEAIFIEQYDTFNDGYNMTKGGEGQLGFIMNEESRLKISKTKKGKSNGPHSDETKLKMSLAKKGAKFTPEHREKLRLAKLGNNNRIKNIKAENPRMDLTH